eukprot:SAG31_NODE_2845_length_5009_cov_1.983299_7_plen_73_part_00
MCCESQIRASVQRLAYIIGGPLRSDGPVIPARRPPAAALGAIAGSASHAAPAAAAYCRIIYAVFLKYTSTYT